MRYLVLVFIFVCFMVEVSFSQLTFYLVDNFEDGVLSSKWWKFGDLRANCVENPTDSQDLITKSCGKYSLNISGEAKNWYVGGVGAYLAVDASNYSRIQFDIYGNLDNQDKIKIEIYDDDKGSYSTESDKSWNPIKDDLWAIELIIPGKGWSRYSIPFSAFKLSNPERGDGLFNPDQAKGSGGLLQIQFVANASSTQGKVNFNIDNIMFTR